MESVRAFERACERARARACVDLAALEWRRPLLHSNRKPTTSNLIHGEVGGGIAGPAVEVVQLVQGQLFLARSADPQLVLLGTFAHGGRRDGGGAALAPAVAFGSGRGGLVGGVLVLWDAEAVAEFGSAQTFQGPIAYAAA